MISEEFANNYTHCVKCSSIVGAFSRGKTYLMKKMWYAMENTVFQFAIHHQIPMLPKH